MLSKTTRLHKRQGTLALDQQQQSTAYLEIVREKLEAIMEQLQAQKKILEERWKAEKQTLMEGIQNRDAKIEKLELRVRQLQRENQQIRYQYGQQVSLMGILKQQNSLLSRQYTQDKERMKETIDLLMVHNHALQQALAVSPSKPQRVHSPKPILFVKPQQFYSMTDLRRAQTTAGPQASRHQTHKRKQPFPSESEEEEPSLVRDLEQSVGQFTEAEGKQQRDWEFQQSRITQVKTRGQTLGLDRMSAVTQQSRQRPPRH